MTNTIRQSASADQVLNAPPATVFPLLCPVREAEWVPGWTVRMIHSASGLAEPGAVFATASSTTRPDGGAEEEVWIISRHEAPRIVAFVKTLPGAYIARYEITLAPEGDGHTRATWFQEITALSPQGAALLTDAWPAAFRATVGHLETLLNAFLARAD
ncbi:MAG: SRPBCC family protein [Rhodobacterales bacterium]|nr:SRPBCC family protein [Rhodobacterales bacterium]